MLTQTARLICRKESENKISIYRAVSIHAVGNGFIRDLQHFFTECMNAFPTMLFFKLEFIGLLSYGDSFPVGCRLWSGRAAPPAHGSENHFRPNQSLIRLN